MLRQVLIFSLLLVLPWSLSAAIEGRFMQYPDIRGDKIVFTYEGDLWLLNQTGGMATRLTNHPATEFAAKISPDGKWLAFTGGYDAGNPVYLMPIDGGVPQRITYHISGQVVTWTPDGKKIIFRSGFENIYRPITKLFSVSPAGELPVALPVPRGVLCSFSPDGKKMVYNTRGREEYYWKRYKGGQYQDIWLYDFNQQQFTPLTTYIGKNSYPMWIGDQMYYVSDQGPQGIANIYRYDFATKKIEAVTHYTDFDVQMPASDGQKIVFLHSGYLQLLEPATGKIQKITVQLPTDRWQLAERTVNPKAYIHAMAITNNGKTAVFEARGEVFLVPADQNQITRNLTRSASTRERYSQISPDGKSLAFFSDKTGEYELYVKSLEPEGDWVPLTKGLKTTCYHLEWAPDSKKILFGTKEFAIFYVDVATRKLVKIDASNQLKNDEFYWEISDYNWSPDSKWVVYSFVQFNRNSKIFLYSLEQQKIYPVTDDFYDNLNPVFDANGQYLYFLSYRNFDVQMDVFEDNHIIPNPVQVMLVQLKAGQKPPFEKKPKDEKTVADETFRIDLDGLATRIFSLPVEAGNYFYLKAGKGLVTWAAVDDFSEDEYDRIFKPGHEAKLELHVFNTGEEKEVVLEEKISDWRLSSSGEHFVVKKADDYFTGKLDKLFDSKKLGEKLVFDQMTYRVEPQAEWGQIFNDTWRWYRDFFYDPDMHGRDWEKIGANYRAYLPQLNSREDLNWLLSQMVGELCVSHTYIGGGDQGPQTRPDNPVFTGLLGAELAPDNSGYYQFTKIFGPTDLNRDLKSPLVRPDLDVKSGDFLIAIDGHEVKAPANPYQYLQVIKGQKVTLTVNSKPTGVGAKTCLIEPIRSEYNLRYQRWLADNVQQVLKASNGDLGYLHITAMGGDNVAEFDKFWRAFRYKKGLIIDVRGNGGGWTEYFILDKLERKMTAYNVLQNMVPFRYPGSTITGPIAVLTNEYNGSDGEAFVEDFKAHKLGTVIGTPSWGGLVGILNGQTTIDNGNVHQSNNAFWGENGKWLVENHGADPDILVDNDPASVMAGHDKQLETAIKVLQEKIAAKPFVFPAQPAYPKK
ncbi:S41 family peptidase [candidate division KSB1 bacterium]|nr:S41 family peptidase [candidate division KSB1 bacterium]